MSDVAIQVENLSKRFRIGVQEEQQDTLVGTAVSWLSSPLSNFRRLRRLSRFDDRDDATDIIWALRDLSFQVPQGEVVGIIGHNGAGKSTLLKVLSRITEPTSGRALINGRVASLLEVGTGFHPELTGRENVYLNGVVLGMSKSEVDKKFDQIVEFAGVSKFIDTPVKRYSSGMKVRLAFAVAAHLEPEILLIDEVLAVGDAAFQRKCLGKMKDIAGTGRTVLFVSHQMSAISNLTSRCLLMKNGYLVEDSATDIVIEHYLAELEEHLPESGYVDLEHRERVGSAQRARAEFLWLRLCNSDREPKQVFIEGEPILFEVGLRVKQPLSLLQMSLGIGLLHDKGELFTLPSQLYEEDIQSGEYKAHLELDPNFLRGGHYRIALKLFAEGERQETIPDAMMLDIASHVPSGETSAYLKKWVSGYFRFNYEWTDLEAVLEVGDAA